MEPSAVPDCLEKEKKWKRDIRLFLKAMFAHFWWWIGATIASVAAGFYQGVGGVIPSWVFWGVAMLGVIIAAFLTWRDELRRAEDANEKLIAVERDAPDIRGRILSITAGTASFPNVGFFNIPIALITVDIRNRGTPSIVEGWTLRVKTPVGETVVSPTVIPRHFGGQNSSGDVFAEFFPEDQIWEKTSTPVTIGNRVRGTLLYGFPEMNGEELKDAEFTLEFKDVNGVKSTCSMHTHLGPDIHPNTLWHYPGTKTTWRPIRRVTLPSPTPDKGASERKPTL